MSYETTLEEIAEQIQQQIEEQVKDQIGKVIQQGVIALEIKKVLNEYLAGYKLKLVKEQHGQSTNRE